MNTFDLPGSGTTLHPLRGQKNTPAPSAEKPPQALCLNLGEATIEEILKSFTHNEKVRLRFGKRQMLHWGTKSRQVYAKPEVYPAELYSSSGGDQENFYFSGAFSHRIDTEDTPKPAAQEDEALATLTQSLNSLKEEAASNEARFVTSKSELKSLAGSHKARAGLHLSPHIGHSNALRKDRKMGGFNRSTSGSPFLGSSNSPGVTPKLGPTSAPMSKATITSKDQTRLEAIRIPLTHLLAFRQLTIRQLATHTGATIDDCQKLVAKCASEVEVGQGKYKLKDKAYKDLDIWKFPYVSPADRQGAIDRSISAFDRMRLARGDKLWQLLLPVEERGKGKCLSRLNLDGTRPVITSRTVKPESKPREDKTEIASKGPSTNDMDGKRQKDASKTTTRQSDNSPPKAAKTPSDKKQTNKLAQGAKKASKQNTKYKSSEIIEDSDEEAEMSEHQPTSITQEAKHEGKTNGVGRKEPGKEPEALQRGEPQQAQQQQQRKQQAIKANSDRSLLSTLNGRPRNGSSPQKPSPLAASPPTNATDVDDSGKSLGSGSGSSTPLMSRSTAKATSTSAHSSSVHAKSSVPAQNSSARPVKRPADTSTDEKAPKRQQTNGHNINNGKQSSAAKAAPQTNGRYHSRHGSSGQSLPPLDTDNGSSSSSSNASSTSPASQITVESLNDMSEHFRKVYARYENFHQKLQKSPDRSDKDLETLNQMHKRVAEIKAEVWKGWKQLQERGLVS